MLLKLLYMYLFGIVEITVEGFFIERFINLCKKEDIFLWSSKIEKGTILKAKISKSDFIKIRPIARKTSCRVSLKKKKRTSFCNEKI